MSSRETFWVEKGQNVPDAVELPVVLVHGDDLQPAGCVRGGAHPFRGSNAFQDQANGRPGGGWWNYGGLTRSVYLRKVDRVDIAKIVEV